MFYTLVDIYTLLNPLQKMTEALPSILLRQYKGHYPKVCLVIATTHFTKFLRSSDVALRSEQIKDMTCF